VGRDEHQKIVLVSEDPLVFRNQETGENFRIEMAVFEDG
jgi:hypothetical protein